MSVNSKLEVSSTVFDPSSDSEEDASEKSTDEEHQRSAVEDLINVHFKFEVREVRLLPCAGGGEGWCRSSSSEVECVQVLLELTRQMNQEKTLLSFSVCQLGAEGKMRSFDLSVTSYLQRVALDYCDVPGTVHLLTWFLKDS